MIGKEITFRRGLPTHLEETRYYEFKEIKGGNPKGSIQNAADEYAVAFLNAEGGSIFWGIRDTDRVVTGVSLDYKDRDEIRRVVTEKLTQIQPPIAPSIFEIPFHQVFDPDSNRPIENFYVVELTVPKMPTKGLYFTGSGDAFVKTDGSKKRLSGLQLQAELTKRLSEKVDTAEKGATSSPMDFYFSQVMRRAKLVSSAIRGAQILWVDDNPGNNIYERMALKSMNMTVDLAISTTEALQIFTMNQYNVVISDMGRQEEKFAGLALLQAMRSRGINTQVIFYTSQYIHENINIPKEAFAITSRADHLLHYVMDILERTRI